MFWEKEYDDSYQDTRHQKIWIIVSLLLLGYFLFVGECGSIECKNNLCVGYTKNGVLGFKRVSYKFLRSDVKSYHLTKKSHREKDYRSMSGYSYHNDYMPVLEFKNGTEQTIPISTCREYYLAEELALDIMNQNIINFKKAGKPIINYWFW